MTTIPQTTFNIGLQLAVEEVYGLAPSTSKNPNWWQGGRWFPAVTSETPDLWDDQATIFPQGRAGSRSRRTRRPVTGRQWSGGGFAVDWTMDLLPLIAYANLGGLSSNMVPSSDFDLLNEEPIPAGASKSLVLATQPSDGGAILRFWVSGTSVGGWISIQGITADGVGASEVISFTSAGSLYSRLSLSAIGASSITMWSDNDATLDIQGIKYWEHIVSTASYNPTLSIQSLGDPTAGAASRMRLFPGMVSTDFAFNAPADQDDGLLTGEANFMGAPTATCAAPLIPSASPALVIPAWTTQFTREGNTYDKVLGMTLDYQSGNRNYKSAAGQQGPQGVVFLSRELTGSFRLFLENEIEYDKWRGASGNSIVGTWNTQSKLTATDFEAFNASMLQLYFEDVSRGEDNDLQILETDISTIEDASAGILKFWFKNRVPGTAYGNTVS